MGHRLRQNQKEALSNQGFFLCRKKTFSPASALAGRGEWRGHVAVMGRQTAALRPNRATRGLVQRAWRGVRGPVVGLVLGLWVWRSS